MFKNMPPFTRLVLIICVVVAVAQWLLPYDLTELLALHPLDMTHQLPDAYRLRPWQPLTYAFAHGGLGHLVMNMLVLVMFGSALEHYWGTKRYWRYYIACALGAAIVQLIASEYVLQQADGQVAAVVGASGALFGLLIGYGMHFPERRVMLLIPPIPMKARTLVILIGLAETLFGVMGWLPGSAHFAHSGGLLTGFLLNRYWLRPNPLAR